MACVSPENFEKNIDEVKKLGFPFGFKMNAFEKTKIKGGYTDKYKKSKTGNPNEFLGQRKDLLQTKWQSLQKNLKMLGQQFRWML